MVGVARREQMCNFIHGLKPTLLMVVVQVVFAGVNVLYKLALNDGMRLKILVAYRFIFASAIMVPMALIFEWKKIHQLTWKVLLQSFFCGLLGGTLAQNLYVESLSLTSATFASATTNLLPSITFIMAVCLRMEKLGLGMLPGKAKVAGTLIGLSGAMLLTFYKGLEINIWSTNIDLLSHGHRHVAPSSHDPHPTNFALGGLLAISSNVSYAVWLIIQAKMSSEYPFHYSSTALMSVMGAIQAVVFALCTERDWQQWKLDFDIRLLTVAYSGMVASGLMVTLISWCVRMRGPLFASAFNPLMLILVALAASLLLDEKLHLGSVLGAVLIVCGLYAVLWGKSKEIKKVNQLVPSTSLHHHDHQHDHDLDSIEIVNVTSPKTAEEKEASNEQQQKLEENDSQYRTENLRNNYN